MHCIVISFSYTRYPSLLFLFRISSMNKQRISFFLRLFPSADKKKKILHGFGPFFPRSCEKTLGAHQTCGHRLFLYQKTKPKGPRCHRRHVKDMGSEKVLQLINLSWKKLGTWCFHCFHGKSVLWNSDKSSHLFKLLTVNSAAVNLNLGGLRDTSVTETKSTFAQRSLSIVLFFSDLVFSSAHLHFCL